MNKPKKIFFFDVDGTLSVPLYSFEYKDDYYKRCCLPTNLWEEFASSDEDCYRNCSVLPCIREFINDIQSNEDVETILIVLSVEENTDIQKAKTKFINTNFENTFYDIFYVNTANEKIDFILRYAEYQAKVKPEDCYLIEDTFTTLIKAGDVNINPIHITNVVWEYGLDKNRRKDLIIEHIKKLQKEGGTDSDIRDFCEENHISFREYDTIWAEIKFKNTPCEKCKRNHFNLGNSPIGHCCNCNKNPRFTDNQKL